jgi:hypothetical protein
MSDQSRTSCPALVSRGWDRDEPTQVLNKALCEAARTTAAAEASCGAVRDLGAKARARLDRTLDRVLDKTGT